MSDLQTRLIEAAVRPLGDNAEMKAAGSQLLSELVEPKAHGVEKAIARWDAVDGKRQRQAWRVILWLLLGVISAGVCIGDYREVLRYVAWREWLGGAIGISAQEKRPDPGCLKWAGAIGKCSREASTGARSKSG